MKQLRARGFALRDVFTDVLRGMGMAEEALDTVAMTEPKNMGMAEVVTPEPPQSWPADLFAARLPEWRKAIAAKRATAEGVIAKAKTKHPLTVEQEAAIRAPDAPVFTAGDISKRIADATNIDELNEAGGLMDSIADLEARNELGAEFDARLIELEA